MFIDEEQEMILPEFTAEDVAYMQAQVAHCQREAHKALEQARYFEARGMVPAMELAMSTVLFYTNITRRYRLYLGELTPHWHLGDLVLEEPIPSAVGAA